ncbi:MAG: autotransporter-associated beta strand repeat-containing protein, partial [Chthoniobacteraceae bacterium]
MKRGGIPILAHALATTLATLVLHAPARAVDGIWTNERSGSWDDPTNWLDGQIADGMDAIADFSTLDITGRSAVLLSSTRTVGTLKFGDTGTSSSDWDLRSGFTTAVNLDVSSGKGEILVLDRVVTIDTSLSGNDGIEIGNGGGTGGRLILTRPNSFTGGLTISGAIVQFNDAAAAGNNTITLSGSSVDTRMEVSPRLIGVSSAITNPIVIEAGVTPGAGHGAVDVAQDGGINIAVIDAPITINGSTGNGGHFAGLITTGSFPFLGLLGAITASVPVVQAGGSVSYDGGGSYPALDVTGTARTGTEGIPSSAILLLGTAGGGDGSFEIFTRQTLAGLEFGRVGSTDRGAVSRPERGTLILTGDVVTRGDATHLIGSRDFDLGATHSTFSIGDGAEGIDLSVSARLLGTAGFSKDGAGTLELNGSVLNTGPISVLSGALAGNTTLGGPLTVSAGAALAPGTQVTSGSLAAPTITFGAGATAVDLNVGNGGDSLVVSNENGLRLDEMTTLNIATFGGPIAIGTHELISYAGTIQGAGFGGFALSDLPGRTVGSLLDTGSVIALDVTGNDTAIWTGTASDVWDLGAPANWKLQSNGTVTGYLQGDDVLFDDSAATTSVIVAGSLRPARTTFANSAPYVFTGTGALGGSMVLDKTGAGSVTLRMANDFAGKTTIREGTLEVDHDGGSLTRTSVVAIDPGATLKLTSDNADFTFDRPISGAGTVVIDPNSGGVPGSREVGLTGDNSGFNGVLRLSPTPGGGSFRTNALER